MSPITEINEATEFYVIGGSAMAVRESVSRLSERFRDDVMTVENLGNLVRALYRLAAYQAGSCDYVMRGFIDNVRRRLNRPVLSETAVPSGMVKDVVLPKYRVPEF